MKPAQHARFASKNTQGSGKDFQVTTVSSSKFLSGGGRPLKRQDRRDYPPTSRHVKENLRGRLSSESPRSQESTRLSNQATRVAYACFLDREMASRASFSAVRRRSVALCRGVSV